MHIGIFLLSVSAVIFVFFMVRGKSREYRSEDYYKSEYARAYQDGYFDGYREGSVYRRNSNEHT